MALGPTQLWSIGTTVYHRGRSSGGQLLLWLCPWLGQLCGGFQSKASTALRLIRYGQDTSVGFCPLVHETPHVGPACRMLTSMTLCLQYHYRPGTITEYLSQLLSKHAKRRRRKLLQAPPAWCWNLTVLTPPASSFLRHGLAVLTCVLDNAGNAPVRVYMDGCFDMMHYGHANALRQVSPYVPVPWAVIG